MSTKQKLRVWWLPQVPGIPFTVPVDTVAEGAKIMCLLADYDKFQLEHNIKPDYCNAGGLLMFDPSDDTDGPEGSWVDWHDELTGEDDPRNMALYVYSVTGWKSTPGGEKTQWSNTYPTQEQAQKMAKDIKEFGYSDIEVSPEFHDGEGATEDGE